MYIVKRRRMNNVPVVVCSKRHGDFVDYPNKKQKILHNVRLKRKLTGKLESRKKSKLEESTDSLYSCLIHIQPYICDIYDCAGVKKRIQPPLNQIPSYIS